VLVEQAADLREAAATTTRRAALLHDLFLQERAGLDGFAHAPVAYRGTVTDEHPTPEINVQ
jgi:hypothetical protein